MTSAFQLYAGLEADAGRLLQRAAFLPGQPGVPPDHLAALTPASHSQTWGSSLGALSRDGAVVGFFSGTGAAREDLSAARSDKRVLKMIMDLSVKSEQQPALAASREQLACSGARVASRVLRVCISGNNAAQFATVLVAAAAATADTLLPPWLLHRIAVLAQAQARTSGSSTSMNISSGAASAVASLATTLAHSRKARVRATAAILLCDSLRYVMLRQASECAARAGSAIARVVSAVRSRGVASGAAHLAPIGSWHGGAATRAEAWPSMIAASHGSASMATASDSDASSHPGGSWSSGGTSSAMPRSSTTDALSVSRVSSMARFPSQAEWANIALRHGDLGGPSEAGDLKAVARALY